MRRTVKTLFLISLSLIIWGASALAEDEKRNIEGHYFYNPSVDDIPFNPKKNLHGPDYDIPNGGWKREADKRIDKYRKGTIEILIKNRSGAPLKGIPIHVELKRHYYNFGAVSTLGFGAGSEAELTKKYFLKYFNAAGFGMSLKPKQCREGTCKSSRPYFYQKVAQKDMIWLSEHNIEVRGHALVWEGPKFLHFNQQAIRSNSGLSDQEKGNRVYSLAKNHFEHAIRQWDVACWDVANEPRANHVIDDYLGDRDTFVDWFKLADSLRTKYGKRPKLYYNENQILSCVNVESYKENRTIYKNRIQDLLDADAPIEGIGFQLRFKKPLSPNMVYKRMQDFEEYDVPMQATEFELVSKGNMFDWDAGSRKKMTAEMMTLFMSHPLSDGFWHWSFMDNDPAKKKAVKKPHALFSWDGKPRAEMEQWIKMMEVDFKTDVRTKSDAKGSISLRGFKGVYIVTIGSGAASKQVVITLQDDVKRSIIY